jgi:hypothetical protein
MSKPIERKISFWRLGLGLLLIFAALKNLAGKNMPAVLVPSEVIQPNGRDAAAIILLLCGMGFVYFGICRLWRRPSQP